jgi:glycosyltransferase 2 family protein
MEICTNYDGGPLLSGNNAFLVKDCTTERFCIMGFRIRPISAWLRRSLQVARNSVAALPGGRMYRVLATLGRGLKHRIGWKQVGIAASLIIIAFAVTTLVHTLKGIDTGVMLVALTEIAPHHIALAALCVVGAFCTLTFYDFFALRTIGKKHVPYRIAALSSFTSYTIGHNIGATVFTGGAIRFRIYSEYGLSAVDVAKICFLSGLTFWLGNTFVLGIGMAWHPGAASAMDQLPSAINRLVAFGVLSAILAYLVWLSLGEERRELGQNGWKVKLPSAPLTLVQILIGVLDLGFCAMAMYLLMPGDPGIDFMSLAVVFILATLLGFASHAPGSIGVFDAAMLVALPQFGREQLLATLVVFRILYFMIPFGIAISIMGSREIWLNVVVPWQKRRKLNEASMATASVEEAEVAQVETLRFERRSRTRSR